MLSKAVKSCKKQYKAVIVNTKNHQKAVKLLKKSKDNIFSWLLQFITTFYSQLSLFLRLIANFLQLLQL
jgi:hypothetical protein